MNEESTTPVLPLEVFGLMIDKLAQSKDRDRFITLKTCALVCHAFLSLSYKRIYEEVAVAEIEDNSYENAPTSSRFAKVILRRPAIASYIKTLVYRVLPDDLDPNAAARISDALQHISNLEHLVLTANMLRSPQHAEVDFNIHGMPGTRQSSTLVWTELSLRPSFKRILQLPTLISLRVTTRITRFSLNDIGPGIKSLSLLGLVAADSDRSTPVAPTPSPAISELFISDERTAENLLMCTHPGGQPVVNLTGLQKFTFVWQQTRNTANLCKSIVERSKNLTYFSTFAFSRLATIGLAGAISPALNTLTHFHIAFYLLGREGDTPFQVLIDEFAKIRGPNSIQRSTFSITVHADSTCTTGPIWRRLDEILSSHGTWPCLKRVEISFQIHRTLRQQGPFEVDVDALAERHFINLTKRSDIHFSVTRLDCTR